MIRVTIDADLIKRLHNLTTPLELCDANGRVLARFTPSTPWTDPDNWLPLTPELSEEEIQRRLSSERKYTTQEVLELLKAL